ncbi:TRAP transporter small permease [Ramlibacter sp.]|uniref:TRAP transporter small permease n=1 Tax=Ramlibacter sp. TaxID=1917967 RepID=UPI002D43C166|nr:TRAP transporter small permease [Ramlibacter sp.]HYD77560.1 TRAP transporter small permease [Ramlibacter sp.]
MRSPDRFDTVLGILCALPCAAIVALTFVDVLARYLLSAPVRGSLEVIEFCMALVIFTALPLVTRHGGHVTVELFDRAGSGVARRIRRALCDALSLLALGLLSWRLWVYAAGSAQSGSKTMVLGLHEAPLVQAMALFSAVSALAVAASLVGQFRRSAS